jgi:hypothetical protein
MKSSRHESRNKKRQSRLRTAAILSIAGVQCIALAQRGKLTEQTEAKMVSPSDGISGFFDANMTLSKHLVFDFPTFSLDYGISPNLTIGTNALALVSLLNWASSPGRNATPILQGKIRYRVFSTGTLASALTLYAGRFSGLGGSTQVNSPSINESVYFHLASLNTSATFAGGQWGGSFASGTLQQSQGTDGTLNHSASRRNINLASLWLRPRFSETLESDLLLTTCLANNFVSESGTARIDISDTCFGDKRTDPLLRALLSWRSSPNWLWSLGVVWYKALNLEYGLPVFGLNYSTPVFTTGEAE